MIHKHVGATRAVWKSVTPERDINFENLLLFFLSTLFEVVHMWSVVSQVEEKNSFVAVRQVQALVIKPLVK